MSIKLGDSYDIDIDLRFDGEVIDAGDIGDIELYFDGTRKLLSENDISYAGGVITIPLSQEETFSLEDKTCACVDIRVKFADGKVIGLEMPLRVTVADAVSREVL